jgi:hypothetical protein
MAVISRLPDDGAQQEERFEKAGHTDSFMFNPMA